MNEVNDKIAKYEDYLRKAEGDIEAALREICPLRGGFPRYELNEALEKVQDALRDVWRLYNNPEVEIAD